MELERLTENLNLVRERISRAALSSGRSASDVTLVAVTKRTPVEWARHLLNAGQHNLGENYPQELWTKADSLLDQVQIQWHLIGHLQSNKLKRTLPLVARRQSFYPVPVQAACRDCRSYAIGSKPPKPLPASECL